MKTLDQIINSEPIYLNDWEENGKIGVVGDFENIFLSKSEFEAKECPNRNKAYWEEQKQAMTDALKKWEDVNILFASYGYENYSGDAWVLFEKDGKLYEVNGSHCSCYGLEGQWSPEEVLLEELKNRLINGDWGEDNWSENNFKKELIQFLGI